MSLALSGLKVLDLTMYLPGPYMTWIMALLGAEVVKVENPDGGDYGRSLLMVDGDISPFFEAVNRNKKSLAVNLKHADGKRLFLRLLEQADVLVEGFRPGTMERLDLGFDVTSKVNSRLVHVSISGYGQSGPNKLRAGHDLNYLALAGILGMTGTEAGKPVIPGIQIADLAGGSLMALAAVLAALLQRERTGNGQYVDVSLFDGALSLSTSVFAGVNAGLEPAAPAQMTLNGRYPCYSIYQTSDGRYMTLAALEPKFWKNFCMAVSREDLLDRHNGGPEVALELEKLFACRTQAEWIQCFSTIDACCEPVLNLSEAVDSSLARARSMQNLACDGKKFIGFPLKLSASPPQADEPAPALGQHTKDILLSLGVTDAEMQILKSQGVICSQS